MQFSEKTFGSTIRDTFVGEVRCVTVEPLMKDIMTVGHTVIKTN